MVIVDFRSSCDFASTLIWRRALCDAATQGVQVLDLDVMELRQVGQLQFGHWLATVTRLPNGMVTVMSDSPSPVGPTPKDAIQVTNRVHLYG